MQFRHIRHKGLRRFVETGNRSGIPSQFAEKISNILSFIQDMESSDELAAIPGWRAHQLTGDRKGTWSLTVTRNWRITFRIEEEEKLIIDLDFEDYH